jgi:hypothetical protein
MDNYNENLNEKFNATKGTVTKAQWFQATMTDLELNLEIKVDAKTWNKLKKKCDPIDALNLVVDLSNFLYRSIGLGVRCPSVGGLRNRCKNGFKHLTFTYQIKADQLEALNLPQPTLERWSYYERISLGPIVDETSKLRVA